MMCAHADVVQWFRAFIGCCVEPATSDQPIADEARALLATSFRGLWVATIDRRIVAHGRQGHVQILAH